MLYNDTWFDSYGTYPLPFVAFDKGWWDLIVESFAAINLRFSYQPVSFDGFLANKSINNSV